MTNAASRAAGEVIAKGASLALFVVMARELGAEGFGAFNFALSLATVLIAASGFGMDSLLAREISRDHQRAHYFVTNVVAFKVVTSLVLVAAMAIIVNVGNYDSDVRLAVYLIGLGVAIENLAGTWHYTMQGFERLALVSPSLIVQRLATAAVGIALLVTGHGLVAVSAVYLGGAVLGWLTAAILLHTRVVRPQFSLNPSDWIGLARTAIPIGIIGLLFSVLLQFDVALLSFFTGGDKEEVGVYSAAFRVVSALFFLSWTLSQAMQPWLTRQGDEVALVRGYALGLKTITAAMLPLGIALAVLAEPIVDLLYGPEYAASVTPLQLLAVVIAVYGINQLTGVSLISRYRPGAFRTALLVVIAQNIACNAMLIPLFGADGAALTAASSAVLLTVLSIGAGWRTLGAIDLSRTFTGPLLAGAAMAAVMLPIGSWLIAGVAGALAYVAMLGGWERLRNRDDFDAALALVRRRARS